MWNRVFFTPSGGCEILSISHPCLYNISGIYLTIHNVWLDKLHRLKFSNVVALFNSVKFVFILYVWLFHFLSYSAMSHTSPIHALIHFSLGMRLSEKRREWVVKTNFCTPSWGVWTIVYSTPPSFYHIFHISDNSQCFLWHT